VKAQAVAQPSTEMGSKILQQERKTTMALPICSGGTISAGVTSIQFTNSNPNVSYKITSCVSTTTGQTMPGWPATDPQIPKAQNGVAGSYTVQLSAATISGNTYEYTPDPECTTGTPPKIKVQ
jgi:hypothetical protein